MSETYRFQPPGRARRNPLVLPSIAVGFSAGLVLLSILGATDGGDPQGGPAVATITVVKGTEYDLYASPAPKKCALDGAAVTVDRSGDGEPLESVDGSVQYPWAGVFEAGKDGKAVLTCDSSSPTLFVTARETNAFNLLLLPSLALFLGSGFWFGWARKRRGSSGYTAKHRPEPPAAGQKARALTRDAAMRHRAVDFIHGTLVAAPDPAEARAALTASLASDLLIRETTDDGWFVEASPTVRIFVSKDDLRSESSAAVIRCAAAKLDLDRRALTTIGF